MQRSKRKNADPSSSRARPTRVAPRTISPADAGLEEQRVPDLHVASEAHYDSMRSDELGAHVLERITGTEPAPANEQRVSLPVDDALSRRDAVPLEQAPAPEPRAPLRSSRGASSEQAPHRMERSPLRVRGVVGGQTVVDSRRVHLLWRGSQPPTWWFPREDVRLDLFEPSDARADDPVLGAAEYWTLRLGDREVTDAAWAYPEAPAPAPMAELVTVDWNALDAWFQEEERAFVHPRDPYTRIDVFDTARNVEILVDGELLARSQRAVMLCETGLPVRYYLPLLDVRRELLVRSDNHTRCPYKGEASYWSIRTDASFLRDAAWTYESPRPEAQKIAGRVCFYDERVTVLVDGDPRPAEPVRFHAGPR